jgi:protein SCO1/2
MNRRQFFGLAPLLAAAPVVAAQAALSPVAVLPAPTVHPVAGRQSRVARSGMLPNVPLLTHNRRAVNFYDDLIRDKTVLLNFFLVQCTDGKCPLATATLRHVQDELGERMGRDVFIYSITLQPQLDTPDILKAYADNFAPRPGWEFLTGKPADIEFLRRSLGYVDRDPERDRDPTNHIGMARYGNDALERWGAVSLRSTPENIASTFKWLSIA